MIIGLCGFINAGKGTVADILVANHGYKKIAFADSLKDTVAVLFGWPRELLEGDTEESRKFRETKDEFWSERLEMLVTPRWVLQHFGTEIMRDQYHKDFWIQCMERKLRHYVDVAIPDVRFPNEILMIRKAGGYVVNISRGQYPDYYPPWYGIAKCQPYLMEIEYPDVHISEWAWIGADFDYAIKNEKRSDLDNQVKMMLQSFHSDLYCPSEY